MTASVTCTVRDPTTGGAATSTTCTLTTVAGNMGTYITKVAADLKCGTLYTCSGGKTYELVMSGAVNQFNTGSNDGQIISTVTTSGSGSTYEIKNALDQIIGTDITSTQLPPYTAATLVSNSLIRTMTSVDSSTAIQFDITLTTRLETKGFIWVYVPNT